MAVFTGMETNSVDIGDNAVVEYVAENYRPEEVFGKAELKNWALNNGFVEMNRRMGDGNNYNWCR